MLPHEVRRYLVHRNFSNYLRFGSEARVLNHSLLLKLVPTDWWVAAQKNTSRHIHCTPRLGFSALVLGNARVSEGKKVEFWSYTRVCVHAVHVGASPQKPNRKLPEPFDF